jgi:xylulose-5-phosphate/fructose-6-phosphate phosphoketolase
MSANPAGNGGQLTVPLRLPDFHKHAQPVDPAERGAGTGKRPACWASGWRG